MDIEGINCSLVCFNSQKEQTKTSRNFRITAVVLGVLLAAAGLGIALSVGSFGWALVAAGIVSFMIGICFFYSRKEQLQILPLPPPLESDSIGSEHREDVQVVEIVSDKEALSSLKRDTQPQVQANQTPSPLESDSIRSEHRKDVQVVKIVYDKEALSNFKVKYTQLRAKANQIGTLDKPITQNNLDDVEKSIIEIEQSLIQLKEEATSLLTKHPNLQPRINQLIIEIEKIIKDKRSKVEDFKKAKPEIVEQNIYFEGQSHSEISEKQIQESTLTQEQKKLILYPKVRDLDIETNKFLLLLFSNNEMKNDQSQYQKFKDYHSRYEALLAEAESYKNDDYFQVYFSSIENNFEKLQRLWFFKLPEIFKKQEIVQKSAPFQDNLETSKIHQPSLVLDDKAIAFASKFKDLESEIDKFNLSLLRNRKERKKSNDEKNNSDLEKIKDYYSRFETLLKEAKLYKNNEYFQRYITSINRKLEDMKLFYFSSRNLKTSEEQKESSIQDEKKKDLTSKFDKLNTDIFKFLKRFELYKWQIDSSKHQEFKNYLSQFEALLVEAEFFKEDTAFLEYYKSIKVDLDNINANFQHLFK